MRAKGRLMNRSPCLFHTCMAPSSDQSSPSSLSDHDQLGARHCDGALCLHFSPAWRRRPWPHRASLLALLAVQGRHGSMTESSRSMMEYLVAVSGQMASKSPLKTCFPHVTSFAVCRFWMSIQKCDAQLTCIAKPAAHVLEAILWSASWTLEHLSSANLCKRNIS